MKEVSARFYRLCCCAGGWSWAVGGFSPSSRFAFALFNGKVPSQSIGSLSFIHQQIYASRATLRRLILQVSDTKCVIYMYSCAINLYLWLTCSIFMRFCNSTSAPSFPFSSASGATLRFVRFLLLQFDTLRLSSGICPNYATGSMWIGYK